MCRLFGFRSVIQSQVHRSLVAADNALGQQSSKHPDGWGVAYYVDGAPHVMRSTGTAVNDTIFQRVSGVVMSETVLAHVRRATVGPISVLNCHPFQYGRWVFAHNGDVRGFDRHREQLTREIAPRLRRFILGETDSETLFFLFLTHLSRSGPLSKRFEIQEVFQALRDTVQQTREICDGPTEEEKALLTVMVTDGDTMAAAQGGKELYWSSYKTRCSDRDNCPSLAPECEQPTQSGFVNHLIISSEPLLGENIWIPMRPGEVVGVDWRMRLTQGSLDKRQLPLAG